ncbi:restriction endonuclease subunit S [Candidatus Saccharibacteria bacterium]|nr:restriction endonuclease subunit S [Candidatus Saccharibacteria bacterium]
MKTYARYKDSGISWIGEIPEHWEISRIRHLFVESDEITSDATETLLSLSQYTGVSLRSESPKLGMFEAETTEGYKIVHKGQFVMNIMLAWNGSYAVSNLDGVISPAYCVFDFVKDCEKWYFHYLLRLKVYSGAFKTLSKGIIDSRLRLYPNKFYTFPVIIPPLEEQKTIAAYLDKKTERINELVAVKQKQIELLKEYKQSLIANAVTKGINPKAKMKDSGVNWIGQIPAHWECCTLRKHLKFVSDKGHPDEQLLSVTREQGVIIRNTESKEENHNVIPTDLSDYKLVKKGQFAINKMKSWQGSYAVSSYTGIVSPAYYVCDLDFENKEFFSIAIRSKAYIPFFTMYSKGIRVDQWDLSPVGLKTIPFFIPPKEEQDSIVSYLKDKTEKIAIQISSIEKQIANLNEYKQSLISDVVTGKVKV